MTKLSVCHIGPLSIHSYRLTKSLARRGYSVTLIADSEAWVAPESTKFVPTFTLPALTQSNFPNLFLANSIRIVRLLRKIQPDLVHLHAQHYYSTAIVLSGLPFILNSWGTEVLELPTTSFPRRTLAKMAAVQARKIIVDARILKYIWKSMGVPAQKTEIIPFGVDTDVFNPQVNGDVVRKNLGFERGEIVVISTRAFYSSHYDVECLVKAVPFVLDDCSNVKFIVKGSGPQAHHLRNLAKQLGVVSHVYFVGLVPHHELAQYLRAADIYVSTSRVDSTSVSLLEAMACGVPPVVTNIPGNREWVRENVNGLLFPSGDAKALAEKIIQLSQNAELRRKFGEKCLQIIKERASWEKCVSKVEEVYSQVV
jgi:glycosyltransferase involved in cell wall biosynthesis